MGPCEFKVGDVALELQYQTDDGDWQTFTNLHSENFAFSKDGGQVALEVQTDSSDKLSMFRKFVSDVLGTLDIFAKKDCDTDAPSPVPDTIFQVRLSGTIATIDQHGYG